MVNLSQSTGPDKRNKLTSARDPFMILRVVPPMNGT
jgi:hypothetical protein